MFTGIIEELGTVASFAPKQGGARMVVMSDVVTTDIHAGDSIAVNGVCLTALDITPTSFSADLSRETLERSTLGSLDVGSRVNLERAVMASSRLSGHIVQGHVDARGEFLFAEKEGDFWTIRIRYPAEISKYLVYKGSIAVEGISLTIAKLFDTHFDIAVIPKTWEMTNLSTLKPHDQVNLEADVIAKYVGRMIGERF